LKKRTPRKEDAKMKAAMFVIALILVSTLAGGAATGTISICQRTADAIERSCQAAAQSDYQLALAKCENITNPGERKACQDQAADLKEALQTCDAQHDARETACARLGPDSYDPVIKPNNFVATIDNPYFPLKPGTTFIYEGQTPAGLEHSEFAVTHNTRVIQGVTCVEVRDTSLPTGCSRKTRLIGSPRTTLGTSGTWATIHTSSRAA